MSSYPQSLVSLGDGIIDHGRQASQAPGATVVIGLGGTGTDLVMKLKREVYKQIQPDDLEAPVPQYKNIKYIVVDCDDSAVKAQKGLPSDVDEKFEYFDISNSTIRDTLASKEIMSNRPFAYGGRTYSRE